MATRNLYPRIYCVLPLVGAGTPGDPIRPKHAPMPTATPDPAPHTGALAYAMVLSDDGKTALVEFASVDRSAFQEILADTDPAVKVFVKGIDRPEDILAEFRKYKKDFSFRYFGVRLP